MDMLNFDEVTEAMRAFAVSTAATYGTATCGVTDTEFLLIYEF